LIQVVEIDRERGIDNGFDILSDIADFLHG
jgi:hypothetical protein